MSKANRKTYEPIIAYVVREWTRGAGDPRILLSIADRESGFNPEAAYDFVKAAKAWRRLKPKFVEKGNPYTDRDSDFSASRGLFQMMVPYHLQKWSWTADPLILNHPIIATIVAGRGIATAQRLGAQTPVDVRMVWKYGPDGLDIPKTDKRYTDRVRLEKNRMAKLGFPSDLALAPLTGAWNAFGTGPQENQEEMAKALTGALGLPLWPGADGSTTIPPVEQKSVLPWLMTAGLIWGMLRG